MKTLAVFLLAGMAAGVAAQPVSAGSDVIERALSRLVPAPYVAVIDADVPADTRLTWAAASDWMRALRDATAAAGLRVVPLFHTGRIDVLMETKPPARPPAPARIALPAPPAAAAVAPSGRTVAAVEADGAASTAAATAPPAPPTPPARPIAPLYVLQPGQRIDAQLAEWAQRAGWSLLWTSGKSWVLPGRTSVSYAGPVDVAVESAIRDLYRNGVPVRLDIWEANKVMEVNHAQ